MKWKKSLSVFLSAVILTSSFSPAVFAEEANAEEVNVEEVNSEEVSSEEMNAEEMNSDEESELMASIVDKKYSSSTISTFRLQKSDFEFADHTDSDYENFSVGRKFTEKRSGSNTYIFNYDSAYPLSYKSYRSNTTHDATAWNQWMRWVMSSEEAALFSKLVATDGNILVGGRYKGHIDTQAGALAGKAYMGIEQKHNEGGKSTRLAYTEKKMSGDETKDSHIEKIIDFSSVNSKTNALYLQVGGTYGNTWGKNRNYAEVHYPQVFLKDNKAPTVKEIKVSGGYTVDGKTYFGNGDKVRVKLILSEPIRCADNNYDAAFSVSASGLSDFKAVEYNETDYTNAELHYEATVQDSTDSRISSAFVVDVSVVKDKVTDLAGNIMTASPNDFRSDNIIIDGYLPRINKAEITSVFSMDDSGNYVEKKEQKNIIKPKDRLVFKIHYNQTLRENYEDKSVFPVKIEDTIYYANAYKAYKDGNIIDLSDNAIDDTKEFDAVEYIIQIPDSAEEGNKITLPATKKNGYWVMDELGDSLTSTYGNLSLVSSKRKTMQKETRIVAQDNENAVFEMTIDKTAPVISLTDENTNAAEGIYDTAEEADVTTLKSNKYKVYIKSNETVQGDVKVELKYEHKTEPDDISTIDTKYIGAYTGENILEDMFVELEVPKEVQIDSTDYKVYIETTAYDEIYNKSVQRFYVAADTIAPSAEITNGNGNGELVEEGDVRYWKYEFNIDEKSSTDDMRLYYKFSADEDYMFTDSSTDYTVKSSEIALDENKSDTIYYYAVDGSGNKSSVKTNNYYISDNRSCEPADAESVSKYLVSRDIEFTGFIEPKEETVGVVYDYLVYTINNGEVKYIQNTDGNNVSIPSNELSNDDVVSYKLVRVTEEAIDDELNGNGEWRSIIYHCDNVPPEVGSLLSHDSSGNIVSVKIGAPYGTEHPKNISSAQIVLSNGTDEHIIDAGNNIKNGVFYMNVDLVEILKENSLPSGSYTMTAIVTDENGHTAEEKVLDGNDIIIDAPKLEEIRVVSAYDAEFDDEIGNFAYGENTENLIAITEESINELKNSGKFFTKKADEYRVETKLYMRYEGTSYPKAEDEDVWYTVSEDSGETWTEYAKASVKATDAEIVEKDGLSYAVYTAGVTLPKSDSDGAKTYYVRFRCGANVYPSDIAMIETKTDTTAPENMFIVDAIGSNETGWSENIEHTSEYVRYRYAGLDKGFAGIETSHKLTKLLDKDGNEVPPEQYADYVEVETLEKPLEYIIFKQRCHIYVQISDLWGNIQETDFECMYIDDIVPQHKVYNENTDEYTYTAVANVASVSFGAVEAGSLTMTDQAKADYESLIENNIIIEENMGSGRGLIEDEIIQINRFRQASLAPKEYDIIATTYETDGSEAETFKVMSVMAEAEEIKVLSQSNSVSDMGKTIRAVETMEFNVPVAQVRGESAQLFDEYGVGAAADLYTGDLVFSTKLNAVLDISTGGKVYVVDRLGRGLEINVNVKGTEFIEYTGHTISYSVINDIGTADADADFIYGKNHGAKITISGNNDIASVKPELSEGFSLGTESVSDTSGFEYEGFYSELVIDAPTGFADCEGNMVLAKLKVKNKSTLEEYNDVILLNTDNKAPVLLEAAEFKRPDKYSPARVLYLFYDRYGIESVYSDMGNGFEENSSLNGVSICYYMKNATPMMKVIDANGNVLQTEGVTIDGIVTSQSLIEGRDYEIEILDADKNPAEAGKYYNAVYVKPVPVEGGKYFVSDDSDGIYVDTEEEIIIEMIDGYGEKVIHKCVPPVDITPPAIFAVQNNSGDYISELEYNISVSDKRSGVEKVYVKTKSGEKTELTETNSDGLYKYYTYTTKSADDVSIVAIDAAGNEEESVLKSNSMIVGDLEIITSQNITGQTNKNVTISLNADDGRRIYTHIAEGQGENYLSPGEYIVSGNDVIFTKNGSIMAECTDEAGNRQTKILSVSNIDKDKPIVTATAEKVKEEDGVTDSTTTARIRFKASGDDDRAMAVYLLYTEIKPGDSSEEIDITKLKEKWNEYLKNPEEYAATEEFKEVFEKLYTSDITDDTTYVDVYENGTHTFYVADRAGNISKAEAVVDFLDETAPVIKQIDWEFTTSPRLTQAKTISGTADLTKDSVEISKETTQNLTNNNVNITLTADEPVRIFGSEFSEYNTVLKQTFNKNGIYSFVIEDKAGNTSEKTINISNIEKRELFIEFDDKEIVIFEDNTESFNSDVLSQFTVYTYDESGVKEKLESETDYTASIDYGGLNITDISSNTFDRNSPYIITYKASDDAGNYVEKTRKVILAAATDVFVTVNDEVPNEASCVYVDDDVLRINVENYFGKAVVKVEKGQLNGAQMKFKKSDVAEIEDGFYRYTADEKGWYTIGVRTLLQDIFVVWVYVG